MCRNKQLPRQELTMEEASRLQERLHFRGNSCLRNSHSHSRGRQFPTAAPAAAISLQKQLGSPQPSPALSIDNKWHVSMLGDWV